MSCMQHRRTRAPKTDGASPAVHVQTEAAIGPRDSAALDLALDGIPPPDSVREDILRRVLKTISTPVTRPPKGRTSKR